MLQRSAIAVGLGVLMLSVPGGSPRVTAAETQFIRLAALAPRDSDLVKRFLRIDKAMRAATNNGWGLRLYAGGVAGDEPDVLRKMKVGQMDASSITTTGLSSIVREVAVLDTPGVITNYKQFEAVTTAMRSEWEGNFAKVGFKLVAWGETGQYRWFSKTGITRPSDLKNVRPWVWPASYILKEIYRIVGCNGVPLGVPEVYGALQTGMIDTVITTAVALVALQWHASLSHQTKQTFGVLVNALVMNGDKYKALPPEVAALLTKEAEAAAASDRVETRKADEKAYENLLKRGYKEDEFAPAGRAEYLAMEKQVREHLVGRLYPPEMLARVQKIANDAGGGAAQPIAAKPGN
ncbi:MAG TPA: TRAP transporter substrate-binding protein DctP [Polyangiales bacterium]|nr:TRAP transporter substrate-binding protein DctP [Polyangiales bacterium]